MKKISLTFLGVLLSITQIGYSQDNVLRCKEEKTSQIPYWVGVTEPTSWTTSHNYYDSDNNTYVVITSSTENEITKLSEMTEYVYDESKKLKNQTVFYWREDWGNWLKSTKFEYEYADDKVAKVVKWTFDQDIPKMDGFTEYVFDVDGQLIKETSYVYSEETDNSSIDESIIYSNFVTFDKPITGEVMTMDYSTMELYMSSKFQITYDEDFNPILKIVQVKNYEKRSDFIDDNKEEWIYSNGKNTEHVTYNMDYETMTFRANKKEVNHYDESTGELMASDLYTYDMPDTEFQWNKSGVYERKYSNIYNSDNTPKDITLTAVENKVNTVKISWMAPTNTSGTIGYKIIRDGVVVSKDAITATEYVDQSITNGKHTYMVQSIYDGEESNVSSIEIINVLDPTCLPPTELKVTLVEYNEPMMEYNVTLEWAAPISENTVLGYNVYRDEVRMNSSMVKKLTYKDQVYEEEKYKYQVSAIYETGESPLSEAIDVVIKQSNINDVNDEKISIYPNPAKTRIYFSVEVSQGIIYDMCGRAVKYITQNSDFVDVSNLKRGIYTIVLKSQDNNKQIDKIIIK